MRLRLLGMLMAVTFLHTGGLWAQTAPSTLNQPPTPSTDPKLVIVISDLHLGAGEVEPGQWSPLEDFRWANDFILFLEEIHRQGGGRTTLVLAGDVFEMWESVGLECVGPKDDLGCSSEQAVRRIKTILLAHGVEMRALGEFSRRNQNRVVFVPGNHDAAVLLDDVWSEVVKAARPDPAEPDRFARASRGYWLSPAGRIIVEHGHQADEANRFDDWPNVTKVEGGVTYMKRPFGEQLVRQWFDVLERKYPVIDNFSSSADGFLYGTAAEGAAGTTKVAFRFVKMLALGLSARQFIDFLGDDQKLPTWKIAEIRKDPSPFWRNAFPPEEEEKRQAVDQLLTASPEAAATLMDELQDEEIVAICDSRALASLRQAASGVPPEQRVPPCASDGNLGYLRNKAFSAIRRYDVDFARHLTTFLPTISGLAPDVLYVYGHTHTAADKFTPRGLTDDHVKAINTGAWQRLIASEKVKGLPKSPKATLASLKIETYPRCYSFVWIKFDQNQKEPLDPKLWYWMYDDGKWSFAKACPDRE